MKDKPLDGWMQETAYAVAETLASFVDGEFIEAKYDTLHDEAQELGVASPPKKKILDALQGHKEIILQTQGDAVSSPPEITEILQEVTRIENAVYDTSDTEILLGGEIYYASRFLPDYTVYEQNRAKQETPLVVAFDCDGVLYNFNTVLKNWLTTRGWKSENLPDPTVYSLHDAWGLSNSTLHREMPEAVKAGVLWHDGDPMMDGITTARLVGELGHTLMVNTARALEGIEKETREATVTWLRRHGIHPDLFHLADPAQPVDKLSVYFDVLFDDHPENVRAALAAGRHAFLVDRVWNAEDTDLPRVSFTDVPELLFNLSRNNI